MKTDIKHIHDTCMIIQCYLLDMHKKDEEKKKKGEDYNYSLYILYFIEL